MAFAIPKSSWYFFPVMLMLLMVYNTIQI